MVPEDDLRLKLKTWICVGYWRRREYTLPNNKLLSGCSGFCSRSCITG